MVLNPEIEITWLWDTFGKSITDKAIAGIGNLWKRFNWPEAEARYRARLREQHRFTRLFGFSSQIDIKNIYTDVYVLDEISAYRRFPEKLQEEIISAGKTPELPEAKRTLLINEVVAKKRIYLLGKPGSGKTTFLRHLVIQACEGTLHQTPIYINLRSFALSGFDLDQFLEQEFEICAFPDPSLFIQQLLSKGNVLVLFDGLDEVNIEENQRRDVIEVLKIFSRKYPNINICITCRIAANDYSFEEFTYLEIADFNDMQLEWFTKKWFRKNKDKGSKFLKDIYEPKNKSIKLLTRTPLLLALLCMVYNQTDSFPLNRTKLYEEAFNVLLKEWDNSKNIQRDIFYQKLTTRQKEKMLAFIAAVSFDKKKIFMERSYLVNRIVEYFNALTNNKLDEEFDGNNILKAIQAQHGLFIENAYNIFSFSHLTFHEYLTASYLVENTDRGGLTYLFKKHINDDQWREVFINIAGLLEDPDEFFIEFCSNIEDLLRKNNGWNAFYYKALSWAKPKNTYTAMYGEAFHQEILLIIMALGFSCNLLSEKNKSNDINYNDHFLPVINKMLNLVIRIHLFQAGYSGNKGIKPKSLDFWNGSIALDILSEPSITSAHPIINKLVLDIWSVISLHDVSETQKQLHYFGYTVTDVHTIEPFQALKKILIDHFGIKVSIVKKDWKINPDQLIVFSKYIEAYHLFLDCLEVSSYSKKRTIISQMSKGTLM